MFFGAIIIIKDNKEVRIPPNFFSYFISAKVHDPMVDWFAS